MIEGIDNYDIVSRLEIKDKIAGLKECNRFFTDDVFLSKLKKIFCDREKIVAEEEAFFRARIFDEEDAFLHLDKMKENDAEFRGYNAKESYVNTKTSSIEEGRMNAKGIAVLYASSDIDTAIREVHPSNNQLINIATIKPKQELRIVDLSKGHSTNEDQELYWLSLSIQDEISRGNTGLSYVFPQYISSYCKYCGYDGISFKSKYAKKKEEQGKGINYTFFDPEKCEPTGSYLIKTEKLTITFKDYDFDWDKALVYQDI